MKNIFKKQNIMPVAVLGAICLIVAALMAAINVYTAPKIADYEAQKVYDSLRIVLDGHFEDLTIPEGAPATVTAMYKVTDEESGDFKGNVVTVKQKGYAGDILLTIGIDAEGKTTEVVITAQSETHGKNINPLLDRLSEGVNADTVADVEAVSGATVSSTAIKSAVADAFKAVNGIVSEPEPEVLPTDEEQILAYAAEMVGDGAEFTNVTPDGTEYVKRIYRENSGKGYVAYLVAISPNYGTPETETLIHINNDGIIVSVKKILWKVSDANPDYGYNPPSKDRVDRLFNDFVGKNLDTVGEVDLVTGATSTGTRLFEGITEALNAVDSFIDSQPDTTPNTTPDVTVAENNAARTVGIVILVSLAAAIAAYITIPIIVKRRKNR